jgi:hypothetical protein
LDWSAIWSLILLEIATIVEALKELMDKAADICEKNANKGKED